MLPESLAVPLKDQLAHAHLIRSQDRERSLPGVFMPDALDRKYPKGGAQWSWFWVRPAPKLSIDPRSGSVAATIFMNSACNARSSRLYRWRG